MSHKSIDVGYIARVEGEGSLHLDIEDGMLKKARLSIFEPPRFFETLLKGRLLTEAPDITARICGICPVAYQMSAVHGAECLAGVNVGTEVATLRRLLYCGEWIESHTVHIFFLHMPDFLGYSSLIDMARTDRTFVEQALFVKKTGNRLIQIVGGRETHPVNVKIGGFYHAPSWAALRALLPDLEKAYDLMLHLGERCVGFIYPQVERDYLFLSLRGEASYPMCEGRIVSSSGLKMTAWDFEEYVEEFQVRGSHALYARLRSEGNYLCGPLARMKHNFDLLPRVLQDVALRWGIAGGTYNPFRSILVRTLEVVYALYEAMQIIESLTPVVTPSVPVPVVKGSARAATEAPRGLLYHRYNVNSDGVIEEARLIPPTSQNQLTMEEDLEHILPPHLGESDHSIQSLAERVIRNHDPCISCAAHFLRLKKFVHASV